MPKFECIVKHNGILEKVIRCFMDSEHAFARLELEGYKVVYLKQLT